jgi:site-specific DNA-adenine methylase
MRFFGGKMRIGKQLAQVIQSFNPRTYSEPFCGMFSVGKHVVAKRTASDNHPDLIELLKAVQAGWQPPDDMPEDRWRALRVYGSHSALRGFAGFGCAWGGKWFQAYARDPRGYNFAATAKKNLLKLAPTIQGVEFRQQDYRDAEEADVTYCDPPYAGTTDYGAGHRKGGFDAERFWDWVRGRKGVVLVSEYAAPDDFECVWSQPLAVRIKDGAGPMATKIERLFKRR